MNIWKFINIYLDDPKHVWNWDEKTYQNYRDKCFKITGIKLEQKPSRPDPLDVQLVQIKKGDRKIVIPLKELKGGDRAFIDCYIPTLRQQQEMFK